MNTMTTVTQVLNHLRQQGYTADFNLKNNCLECNGSSLQINPKEFVVDQHFRFEGPSDPAGETIIYAISSPGHNIKGVLLNAYGIYSDDLTNSMIQALSARKPLQQVDAITENTQEISPGSSGARKLDAGFAELDIQAFKIQIKTEDTWKYGDRNAITLYKSEDLRIVLIALHAGAAMKTHTAPGIITVHVLEGRITFRTEERAVDLSEGKIVVLQSGAPHSVFANEESVFLLSIPMK